MKRYILFLIASLVAISVSAQRITHDFRDVSMSKALKIIEANTSKYKINFIYNELEDFTVTTSIDKKTVPDAIRDVIGFYPIRMTVDGDNIFVECVQKENTKLIGEVIDKRGQPIVYANISLLSAKDSTFINGGVSNLAGKFVIPCSAKHALIKISCIGYKTILRASDAGDIGKIIMAEDMQVIKGVIVNGSRPSTRLISEGYTTQVSGTLLANVGDAQDVLKEIPRIHENNDEYTVFGKGTPLIYINGKKITDNSDLKRITSQEVKSVDVITSPGAQYDAEARSVIKIKTIRQQGNGLSGNLLASANFSRKNSFNQLISLNWRHNGLDLFGTFNAISRGWWNDQVVISQKYIAKDRVDMTQATSMRSRRNILTGKWGFNYQLNDNNSLGVTYSVSKMLPSSKGFGHQNYTVYTNGTYTGAVKYYDNESASSEGPNHEVNAYYSGIIGRLHLDFNGTLYWKKSVTIQNATEQSDEFDNRSINADAPSHNRMAAAKVVATYPLGNKVNLNAGTEYTNTNSRSAYVNQQNFIISSDDNIKERNIAAFANVDIQCGNYKFNGGLRYEHVKSNYYSYNVFQDDASRKYDNFFPNLSIAYSNKGWNTSLLFTEKTERPYYDQLSGFIRYDDRYTYEGGNPLLHPMKIYNIEWNLQYSWLTFSADYTYDKDQIMYTSSIYNNSNIILARYTNIDHRQNLNFSATASPVFGLWHPVIEMDFYKQFLDTRQYGIDLTLQRPQWDLSINNRFVFKHNWIVECNYEYSTSYDDRFDRRSKYSEFDLGITKLLLNTRLMTRLQVTDLFNTNKEDDFNHYSSCFNFQKYVTPNYRGIRLTISYRFNNAGSKYKGTGAGNEEKKRL